MGSIPEKQPLDAVIAIKPNNPRRVAELSEKIGALGPVFSAEDNDCRLNLLKQARSLVQALETPRETMIKQCWAQPAVTFVIATGIESGLFDYMAKTPGPKTVGKLAAILNFDPDVLARGYPYIVGGCWPTFGNFPSYLKKNNWRIAKDPRKGPMQDVIGEDSNFFQHMMTNYPAGEFQNHMAGYRQGRASWMDPDFYPVVDRLVRGADASPDAAFLVDIGGSIGHDLDEFCRKHPTAPGRHILQDLSHVLSQITKIDPKIERMAYDFHTEQPITGARAYYMHSVLHDWTDEVGRSILARVTAAMRPGYSKLLINENVLPPTDANWQTTALDMMMLTLFASRERTEAQWRQLLEPAGLKIVNIWSNGEGVESLIECELA
ncbi:O-methyltransferase mpaG [Colletotrichum orbiculare MAFF 240422]|uniref:O-methyltransferase mpaG n=1 Tax=Colletotrichum orbiculare (strain 104-T / ATCC 96160 / CBS 514.97 / LARS 414 / MAFF 240422) TaxID=1213857 RepID=A0A484FEZ1_COLOR|nr:O-methyltransferase mpaG [Colletotrichum orbiculare MAFF 240422]